MHIQVWSIQILTEDFSEVVYFFIEKYLHKKICVFYPFRIGRKKKYFNEFLYIIDGSQKENSKKPHVFMFLV